jgi:hypothetical protein
VSAITEAEYEKHVVPGLERAIPKNKGVEFGSLLHQLAAELVASPYGPTARGILLEIDPEAKQRLPKRPAKKSAAEPAPETAAPPEMLEPQPTPEEPKAKPPRKKPEAELTEEEKKSAKKSIVKKATESSKKSRSTQLSRRKPR